MMDLWMDPIYFTLEGVGLWRSNYEGELDPFQAPFLYWKNLSIAENPVKPPFSVPVENMSDNCSVWQNTADLHPT
jgi:hypothetical protein